MQYIDLNEELASLDAHVLAGRLAALMSRYGWWQRVKRNHTAIAAFVEDLADLAHKLTREELYVLERAAYEVRNLDAYEVAYARLHGFEDVYAPYEWAEEDAGL